MILFVTSMTRPMYETHGKSLIENINYPILVCTEGISDKVGSLQYDIMKDEWLCEWLEKNKDVIPKKFGGKCKKKLAYFNHNASKWIRKVASLKHACENYEWDVLVWIDADCSIIKPWDDSFVQNSFSENSVCFYNQGSRREDMDYGIETGLFGVKREGIEILRNVFKTYESDFRKLNRWDDGYVFRHRIKTSKYVTNDLCSVHTIEPIKHSIWSEYITHHKGLHKIKKIYK